MRTISTAVAWCVCVCVRACVRACVRVCVCVSVDHDRELRQNRWTHRAVAWVWILGTKRGAWPKSREEHVCGPYLYLTYPPRAVDILNDIRYRTPAAMRTVAFSLLQQTVIVLANSIVMHRLQHSRWVSTNVTMTASANSATLFL